MMQTLSVSLSGVESRQRRLIRLFLLTLLILQTVAFVRSVAANSSDDDIEATLDAGDLPDSGPGQGVANYATGIDDNGPTHLLSPVGTAGRVWLGDGVDAEFDGTPSIDARGDDLLSSPDEDGVVPLGGWSPGATASFQAEVSATSPGTGIAVLGGWLDWDGNGIFEADEFYSWTVDGGINTLNLTVSSDYQPGSDVYARFRLFGEEGAPGGSLELSDYGGQAVNGEVEDYRWSYTGPTAVTLSAAGTRPTQTDPVFYLMLFFVLFSVTYVARRWRAAPA